MSDPNDERERIWTAVGKVSDRVTSIEAKIEERHDMTREMIFAAVHDAMPKAMLNDEEHRWVQLAIRRETQLAEFRKKVIESATIWALLLVLGAALFILKEFFANHGWKP